MCVGEYFFLKTQEDFEKFMESNYVSVPLIKYPCFVNMNIINSGYFSIYPYLYKEDVLWMNRFINDV